MSVTECIINSNRQQCAIKVREWQLSQTWTRGQPVCGQRSHSFLLAFNSAKLWGRVQAVRRKALGPSPAQTWTQRSARTCRAEPVGDTAQQPQHSQSSSAITRIPSRLPELPAQRAARVLLHFTFPYFHVLPRASHSRFPFLQAPSCLRVPSCYRFHNQRRPDIVLLNGRKAR